MDFMDLERQRGITIQVCEHFQLLVAWSKTYQVNCNLNNKINWLHACSELESVWYTNQQWELAKTGSYISICKACEV